MFDTVQNAAARFSALSRLFDARTIRCLTDRGLGTGWHCLEVAAGNGSIARRLAECVGPRGRVVATDIDTRHLDYLECDNLEVIRHDVIADPLPDAAFDLVHARMILIHLPERDEVLARLARAVKRGGWLVCEEFDGVSIPPDPRVSPGEVSLKTHEAMDRLSADRRVDRGYGRLLFSRFRACGLDEIGAEGHLSIVQAGSTMAALLRASYELRREAMIAAEYLDERQFDEDVRRMDAPDFMMPSPIMWTVWGRRSTTCAWS